MVTARSYYKGNLLNVDAGGAEARGVDPRQFLGLLRRKMQPAAPSGGGGGVVGRGATPAPAPSMAYRPGVPQNFDGPRAAPRPAYDPTAGGTKVPTYVKQLTGPGISGGGYIKAMPWEQGAAFHGYVDRAMMPNDVRVNDQPGPSPASLGMSTLPMFGATGGGAGVPAGMPMAPEQETRADVHGTGTTNLADQRRILVENAKRREAETANAAMLEGLGIDPRRVPPGLMGMLQSQRFAR